MRGSMYMDQSVSNSNKSDAFVSKLDPAPLVARKKQTELIKQVFVHCTMYEVFTDTGLYRVIKFHRILDVQELRLFIKHGPWLEDDCFTPFNLRKYSYLQDSCSKCRSVIVLIDYINVKTDKKRRSTLMQHD